MFWVSVIRCAVFEPVTFCVRFYQSVSTSIKIFLCKIQGFHCGEFRLRSSGLLLRVFCCVPPFRGSCCRCLPEGGHMMFFRNIGAQPEDSTARRYTIPQCRCNISCWSHFLPPRVNCLTYLPYLIVQTNEVPNYVTFTIVCIIWFI
jgi:hypothetical protein